MCVCVCVSEYVCVCEFVCVCVQCVCVQCVCVCAVRATVRARVLCFVCQFHFTLYD